MIKHADYDHHYFGHLALVDQEKQVVQGSPTQRSELAIRTCDVKNNTWFMDQNVNEEDYGEEL